MIVLLHGFGAPGTDLLGLAEALGAPRGTRFVFPEAPLALDVGVPGFDGRAWWHIDMMRLQLAVQTGSFDGLAEHVPEGLGGARSVLTEFLEALDTQLPWSPGQTVLGGFSQGAMLSCDLVLHSNLNFAGLLLMSGSLINAADWSACLARRPALPFFQSHGRQDPVLPYALAERLHALLTGAGWPGHWVEFSGGHGIGPEALRGATDFLNQVLSPPAKHG